MTAGRALFLVPVLLIAFFASDVAAKQGAGKKGNGPAFCRNGQGHPVHGWRWCEDKGWDRSGNRVVQRDRRGRIVDTGRVTDGRRTRQVRRTDPAFDSGYSDGYDKGLEDADKNRSYDPTRHGWYRSADRGYDDDEYGTKAEYKNVYRDGFRDGYEVGYRDFARNDRRARDGSRSGSGSSTGSGTAIPRRWPF